MGEKVLFYISPYYQDRLNVNNGVICKYENVTTPTKSDQNTTTTNGESEIKEIEGRKVIFHFKSTPEMFGLSDKDAEYADMADEYAVVKIPANAGIMIYGKFNDQWKANPSGRFAIRYLLESISQLQSRVKELEGLNEAAEKHIEIIARERDWQTDVVVPDLDQQIAALKQENERLKGGESKIDVKKLEEQLDAFLSKQSPEQLREWMELNSKGLPTAPTNDKQTDK